MGWIEEARMKSELRITKNRDCPFCNPELRTDVETKLWACWKHKWVNGTWYEKRFR